MYYFHLFNTAHILYHKATCTATIWKILLSSSFALCSCLIPTFLFNMFCCRAESLYKPHLWVKMSSCSFVSVRYFSHLKYDLKAAGQCCVTLYCRSINRFFIKVEFNVNQDSVCDGSRIHKVQIQKPYLFCWYLLSHYPDHYITLS